MNNPAENKFTDMLDTLRKHYLVRLQSDKDELVEIVKHLSKADNEIHLAALKKKAHGLAGTGTTFGLPMISQHGSELEEACKANVSAKDLKPLVLKLIDECRVAITHYKEPVEAFNLQAQQSKLINIVSNDDRIFEDISALIRFPNYEVKKFGDLLALNTFKAWPQSIPEIVIVVTDFSKGDYVQLKHYLDQFDKDNTPEMIYVSALDNFDSRLQAVQLGGQAYFTMPLDIEQLAEKIQSSIRKTETEPYHVLIIDDDQILAETYSVILEKAGIKTTVINDPRDAVGALEQSMPDIILTDFYLPHCNGLELASILRQYDIYLSIPIMFISSEVQLESLLREAKINIEDFLTKPIKPSELVTKVSKRAARSRALRDLMVKDALTGALNRTKFAEEFKMEIEKAKTKGSTLSYGLIDIDNFKSINDTYGHAAGDIVIKSLVRNLKQQLRGSDIIGRYGGDEFAVVLLDTSKSSALLVMDKILKKFSGIKHRTKVGEFSAAFSCGIASLEQGDDMLKLSEIADAAMYEAKKQGRGRVVSN